MSRIYSHLPLPGLIGRALPLYSTLSNQRLLEKYLEKYLLNDNVFQMLSRKCSQTKFLENHLQL